MCNLWYSISHMLCNLSDIPSVTDHPTMCPCRLDCWLCHPCVACPALCLPCERSGPMPGARRNCLARTMTGPLSCWSQDSCSSPFYSLSTSSGRWPPRCVWPFHPLPPPSPQGACQAIACTQNSAVKMASTISTIARLRLCLSSSCMTPCSKGRLNWSTTLVIPPQVCLNSMMFYIGRLHSGIGYLLHCRQSIGNRRMAIMYVYCLILFFSSIAASDWQFLRCYQIVCYAVLLHCSNVRSWDLFSWTVAA